MKSIRGAGRDFRKLTASHESVDAEGTWAISYGDMVTLLLCFFIMFFNISPTKKEMQHFKIVQEALQSTLNGEHKMSVKSGFRADIAVGDVKKESEIEETVLAKMGGKLTKKGDQIIIDFPEISFFELGQTKVRPDALETLQKFAKVYIPFAGEFRLAVLAYTDDVPVRRGHRLFNDNLELSALRSVAAMRGLQNSGIPVSQMRIAGHGEAIEVKKDAARLPAASRGDPLARKVSLIIEPLKRSML